MTDRIPPRIHLHSGELSVRHPNDAYDTPPELALAICVSLATSNRVVRRVLEPTAGTGSFVSAARATWHEAQIAAIDLDAGCEDECRKAGANKFLARDILTIPGAAFTDVDLVVGNPPFVAADRIVRHIFPHLRNGASIAFLLAITFHAGKDRWLGKGDLSGLYQVAPVTTVQPIVPRPYFGLDNDPKFEAALFTWTKGSPSLVSPILWDKPSKKDRAKLRTFTP